MLKIAFDPIYIHQLKIGHRFPMEKYELLPQHLLRKNICNGDNFFSPLPIEKQLLLSTHVWIIVVVFLWVTERKNYLHYKYFFLINAVVTTHTFPLENGAQF